MEDIEEKDEYVDISQGVEIGCDPEIFIKKGNHVVSSDKILKENISSTSRRDGNSGKVIRDGIQIELNPNSSHCRALLSNNISRLFKDLNTEMANHKGHRLCFDQVVKLTAKELASSSPDCKTFGCMPSFNIYLPKDNNISKITVDPSKYLYRGGGGHIHLGVIYADYGTALDDVDRMVPLLDLIVGNTCVLIDRNPLNVERRKNYGKAGEYRRPTYGLEYRTLSNFWLKDSHLFSLVTGLARLSVAILVNSTKHNYYDKLMSVIDMKDVEKAINENDYDLAWSNWVKIKPVLKEILPNNDMEYYPFTARNLDIFEYFVKKGINYWFKGNPLNHWIKLSEGHGIGWETFMIETVEEDYKKHKGVV